MTKGTFILKIKIVLFAALMGLASCQPFELENLDKEDPQLEQTSSQTIQGQYIVILKQDAINARMGQKGDYNQRTAAMRKAVAPILHKAKVSDQAVEHLYSSTVLGFSARLEKTTVERLKEHPEVLYIEQDRIITLAPPLKKNKPDSGDKQTIPYGITRVGGADNYVGSNVAWIIDTGIDLDHPDLNVVASLGFNAFANGRDAKSLDDGNGHGTHVAGTVAAINNNIGVVGVAAGAQVIPVKVLNSQGSGTYSGVISGVDYVAANGKVGDVANMSLGGPASKALDEAVLAAAKEGIWFTLAAGNDSDDAENYSPARVDGKKIITVSAMDKKDGWASFSNYGNPPIDFCAPGVSINSTWKGGGYHTISGTSMAAPHVAGVILATAGSPKVDGTVNNDPDGNADPIVHR